MNIEIRKALKLGEATLAVTLPKNWVKAIGLKSGDPLIVREEKSKLVIEKANNFEKVPPTCIIRSEACINEPGMLMRMIIGAYINGYDIIYIPVKGKSIKYYDNEVKKASRKLLGLYINELSEQNIVLNVVTDPSKPTITTSIINLHLITNKIIKTAISIILSDHNYNFDEISLEELYDEFDKIYLLAVRQLLKSQYDKTLLKTLGLKSYLWIVGNRAVLSILKTIFYNCKDLIDISIKLKKSNFKLGSLSSNILLSIFNELIENSELSIKSLILGDAKKANEAIIKIMKLRESIDNTLELISEKPLEVHQLVMLACFFRVLRSINNSYKLIAEIAINRATELTNKYVIIDQG